MEIINRQILKVGHAGVMELKNGTRENYGVKEIRRDNLVYWTGLGLKKIWSPNMDAEEQRMAEKLKLMDDEQLKSKGYLNIIPLNQIAQILF